VAAIIIRLTTLASPARLEIVETFSALGRASARELAAHLGRSPGAVYHHLRALEQAGLVREVARRAGTRRPEVVIFRWTSMFMPLPRSRS
jgi:DNA-binding transcriptional ArsR family regulator